MDSEHRGGVGEGGRDVVAVPDVRQGSPRAPRRTARGGSDSRRGPGRDALRSSTRSRPAAGSWPGRSAAAGTARTCVWRPPKSTARGCGATSASASRVPSASADGGQVTMPPNSCIAISNPVRVRSDGLSNSRASECPASAWRVGAAAPNRRSRFNRAASARQVSSASGGQVQHRQIGAGGRERGAGGRRAAVRHGVSGVHRAHRDGVRGPSGQESAPQENQPPAYSGVEGLRLLYTGV